MMNEKKAPAEMSDTELVEAIAVEVMGWRWFEVLGTQVAVLVPPWRAEFSEHPVLYKPLSSTDGLRRNHFDGIYLTDRHEFPAPPPYLTDWNHWRQVEEKIMEDEKVWLEFACEVFAEGPDVPENLIYSAQSDGTITYMKTPLHTRCIAALSALRSSPTDE